MCQWRTHNLLKIQGIRGQERRHAGSYCRNLHLMGHLFEFLADVAIKGVTIAVVDNPLAGFGIIHGLVRRGGEIERARHQLRNVISASVNGQTPNS